MKLLMLGSGSYTSTLSIRLVALGRHLGVTGWKVAMILPSADKYNNFTPEPRAALPDVTLVQPWQLATRSAMLNLIPYLFTALWAILRARADVIYLYKPTPITILGLAPKFLLGKPVILDLDDLGSEVMKAEQQSAFQYKLVAICERLAMRFSTAIVVTSTYLEAYVTKRYPDKPILLLPNGVEPSDYTPPTVSSPQNNIYYFGAINRLILIETLLQALPDVVQAVPDVRVTIVGGGQALPEAKKLVRKLGVNTSVTFTGWTNMLEAQKYARLGDVAVCYQPNTETVKAASNMKVFQYMAMSTVPLVSAVGDLGSYVQNGSAGVIAPPDNALALSECLVSLLKDTKKRALLARHARHLAETEYAWATRAQKLDSFIHSLQKPTKKDVL